MRTGVHFHGKLAKLELVKVSDYRHASDAVILHVQVSPKAIKLIESMNLKGIHGLIDAARPEVEVTVAID